MTAKDTQLPTKFVGSKKSLGSMMQMELLSVHISLINIEKAIFCNVLQYLNGIVDSQKSMTELLIGALSEIDRINEILINPNNYKLQSQINTSESMLRIDECFGALALLELSIDGRDGKIGEQPTNIEQIFNRIKMLMGLLSIRISMIHIKNKIFCTVLLHLHGAVDSQKLISEHFIGALSRIDESYGILINSKNYKPQPKMNSYESMLSSDIYVAALALLELSADGISNKNGKEATTLEQLLDHMQFKRRIKMASLSTWYSSIRTINTSLYGMVLHLPGRMDSEKRITDYLNGMLVEISRINEFLLINSGNSRPQPRMDSSNSILSLDEYFAVLALLELSAGT